MNLFSIIWLGLVVVLGFLEAVTVTLTSIWFAVGALAAMAVALFGGALWVQILVFAAVSLICVLALRPLAQTRLGGARKIATNADRIIGQEAVVKESIDNVAGHRRRIHRRHGLDCPQRQHRNDPRRQRGSGAAHRRRQGVCRPCFRSIVTISPYISQMKGRCLHPCLIQFIPF